MSVGLLEPVQKLGSGLLIGIFKQIKAGGRSDVGYQ
jgi:hypothetical protein